MQKLETFDWTIYYGRGVAKGSSKYPDELFDGSIWKLVEGVDYTCKEKSIRSMLQKRAKMFGRTVKSQIVEGPEAGIVFQSIEDAPSS